MFRFVLLSTLALLGAASAQYGNGGYHRDPKTAAILSEQRYLSGDGKFGAAYTQEDGTDFKEETDADGNRRGSYSYVDPTGQRRTISYVAGKNGFQASGDHLPVAPPAPAQPAPQPQQHYQAPQPQNYGGAGGRSYDDDGQYDPRWNDPNFSQNQYSAPAPVPPPAPAPQQHYHHQQPAAPAPQYQQHYAPAPQAAPAWTTTPAPHRFQPPGKLQLNRTPDGYSYTFNKV
ncbi:larval cuticle protein 1 [Anopheles bellator]|uniref:larval cuticle protein 1 n=1 Tax=Anopheles bellator TaxID=139047 RepID=UPI0026481614|nr:larval cuticle protein 1 [Anopheles bellator]